MATLDQIDHIVVLMLENRSFDSMLGTLYPAGPGFDGLTGGESNPAADGTPVAVWNAPGTDTATMTIPAPDPGELWTDINQQIFGAALPSPAAAATMRGFVQNYGAQAPAPAAPSAVMHYLTPEQVPVISSLAREFAVCDCWHAAAPCQTWPNRFFVHTATANGYENNAPSHFPYLMPTIFDRLSEAGQGWKIYFHDVPQALTLTRLWEHIEGLRFYNEFRDDAANGTLPAYSFIEPRYFPDLSLPNDEHPPHVVTLGEQLIADVYNCLRGRPAWTKTLLIVTYDEHGGCYDHVPPPAAAPPGPVATAPFAFDRYGVRVPAVLVSPFIKPGTVLRAPAGGPPFDHSSIVATLRRRFALGAPLSQRDRAAPDLADVLNLAAPDNLGPASIAPFSYVTSPGELARAHGEPLNDMQQSLVALAAHLPPMPPLAQPPADVAAFIETHVQALLAKTIAPLVPAPATRAEAVHFIKQKLSGLFKYF